jgi:hypothetical protein
VRHDVVHLTDDPGAFGNDGEFVGLVALAFEAFGAVVQFLQVGPPRRGIQAEAERCHDQAGEEDRGVPPVGAADLDGDSDGGGLEGRSGDHGMLAGPPCGHGVEGDERGRAADQLAVERGGQAGAAEDPAEYRLRPHPAHHEGCGEGPAR